MLDGLAALVDQSLVRQHESGDEPRFGMLETIREYAAERLAAGGDAEDAARAHRDYFLAFAEEETPALRGHGQVAARRQLEGERDNLRAALAGALARGEADAALRFSTALFEFWFSRGENTEGREWLEQAIALDAGDPILRGAVATHASVFAWSQGDLERGGALAEQGYALAKAHGDRSGEAFALVCRGAVALMRGDAEVGIALSLEARRLFRALGDDRGEALTLASLGVNTMHDRERALEYLAESHALFQRLGDVRFTASMSVAIANVMLAGDEPERATDSLDRAEAIQREYGFRADLVQTLYLRGLASWRSGATAAAILAWEESLALGRELGARAAVARVQIYLGRAAGERGERFRAAARFAEGLRLIGEIGAAQFARAVADSLRALTGDLAEAERFAEAARFGGAADAFEAPGDDATEAERERLAAALAAARVGLGEAGYAAAWEAGRAWSLERAVAEAVAVAEGLAEGSGSSIPPAPTLND